MRARNAVVLMVALSLGGVAEAGGPEDDASGGPPPATSEPRDDERDDDDPHPGRIRVFGTGIYLPYVGLGKNKHGHDIAFRHLEMKGDPAVGRGLGGRLGVGNDVFSLGVLYLFSHHRDRDFEASLDVHQAYLDALVGVPLGNRWARVTLQLGAGFGGMGYHYDRLLRDQGGGAAMCRARGGLVLFDHLQLSATAGLFLWGYPGRTVGTGGFAGFEVGFVF